MAMFKKGDRVQYYGPERRIYRKCGTVFRVDIIKGEPFLTVDMDNGEEWGADEGSWEKAYNSSNPVVANALESARAVNADFTGVRRELERNLLEMERIAKEYGHLATRDRKIKADVDRLTAAKASPDERKALDALRREIFAASRFRD